MKSALSNPGLEAGEAARLRGDYLEARGAFEAALDDPDPLVVGAAHHCIGKLAWHEGAYEAAALAFEKTLAIALRHDAAELRARAEIGLGGVCFARGQFDRARRLYEGVKANPAASEFIGMVLLNLGAISNIQGDIAAAQAHYTTASRYFAANGELRNQMMAFNYLGMLLADKLEWVAAVASYEKSRALAEQIGDAEALGTILMNRSELSCAMGRYEQAVEQCDAALAIFAEIGAEIPRGTTLRWKGRALRELAQYQLAERALTEAMRIAHRAQARLLEAETMQELGAMLAHAGEMGAARRWLQRSLDLFRMLGATREADELRADLQALDDG
jgi:tetratricopeptide (TPR) repeat protein